MGLAVTKGLSAKAVPTQTPGAFEVVAPLGPQARPQGPPRLAPGRGPWPWGVWPGKGLGQGATERWRNERVAPQNFRGFCVSRFGHASC